MEVPEDTTGDARGPSLWQELGVPAPRFEAGEGPPLSDEDLRSLRAFVKNEPLSAEEVRRVSDNLGRWRSWVRSALHAVLQRREEATEVEGGPPVSQEDLKTLEAYLKNELGDEEDEEVARKIELWRSWRQASSAVRRALL